MSLLTQYLGLTPDQAEVEFAPPTFTRFAAAFFRVCGLAARIHFANSEAR
jgi:hypothetical protein